MEEKSLDISNRLIALRKKKNVTQQEMADSIVGITTQMISSYETGKQKPAIENLIKISKYFDSSLDYICLGYQSDLKLISLDNYAELIRVILALENKEIFTISCGHSIQYSNYSGRNDTSNLTLETHDKILEQFYSNYQRLLQAKDLLGDEMFNIALESLVDSYKDKVIE